MFIFNGSFVDSSFFFFSHSSSRVDFIQGIVDETATLISHIVENRLGAHCNSDVFLLSFSLFIARLWSQRMHNEVLQIQVWCWRCYLLLSLYFTLHERVFIATGANDVLIKGISQHWRLWLSGISRSYRQGHLNINGIIIIIIIQKRAEGRTTCL